MFKQDRREIFSFRKYKNGRTDSKLIGATLLALGVGLVTTTHSVSADVVNGVGGHEVALVDSVDKTTSANTNTFTDNTDTTKTAKFDAVLNKGVAEPTKANENKGEADGTDTVNLTSETTVNYKLEEDNSLLKTETVATGQGTVKTPYDKKGLAADTDGKDYRESTANKSGITVSEKTGKQDTLELNGKVYERTRSEVEGDDKVKYSKTQFNDIEASVSPEGMHNNLGEINYTKTTGKVYLVEETTDGQYGKYVVADNGVSSDEDAVSKWKAGQATAKDFTKANVTLQEGDSILVLDKDTYAVGDATTVKTVKKFKSPTFALSPDTRNSENSESFDSPTFTIQDSLDSGVSVTTLGPDGRFKTGDDVTETTVADSAVFGFDTADFIYQDNPYFQLSPRKADSTLQTPTAAEALKNNKSYHYLFDLLKFAEQQANTPEEAKKVADVKAKVDAYFEELPAKLKALGADVVWVNDGVLANTYAFYSPKNQPLDVAGLGDLLSPTRNLGKIIETLTFKNIVKQEFRGDTTLGTNTIEKSYTVNEQGSISMTKTTTHHIEGQVTRERILENLVDNGTTREEASKLLKQGTVTVNDDGSVTLSSTETTPEFKFFEGEPSSNIEATYEDGYYIAQPDSGVEFISATETITHKETTYNKHEIITPIRAYKVVADGTSTVTHYYREKKAPLNVNYYLENTTTSLAPSENQADLPVKSDYTTQAKEIPSKTEVQDLPEKTVTTVTTYELVATPDNANGKITEGGTTVNYFYRAVVKTTEVAKQAPVVVNHYLENTETKLADSVDQGQKEIGSQYSTSVKDITPKVEVQDFEDRVVTRTTTYELVSEPTDKEGTVPVGGKVVNYFYRAVVKEDTVMKKAPVLVNYYEDGTETKLADSVDKGEQEVGSNYTSEAKEIAPIRDVQELPEKTVVTTTTYTLKETPKDTSGIVPVGGKVINYYYVKTVTVDETPKTATVVANYYLDGTTDKLADSEDFGLKNIGSDYSTVAKDIPSKTEVVDTPEKTVTTTTTYTLKEVPSDKDGHVPVGGKVVNYYYVPTVTVNEVLKQAPVVANYYLEGTNEKLADSDNQGDKQIGSNYSTVSKEITPKTEVQDLVDRVITTVTTYELVATPTDAEGTVPSEGKVVNYYYRPTVSKTTVMKKAPLTVNYLLEGTREALHPQDVQEELVIHSDYATTPVEIAPKVERKVERNKEVITTTRYELVATPNNAKGTISVGGTVVDYFYRAVVTVEEYPTIPNEAPKTDLPEYTDPIGTPGIPEVHDKPTYLGHVGKPGDPEVHELPEFNGGVIPNDAPKVESPTYDNGTVPNDAPIHELPEYKEPIGSVPNEAPKFELPEFKGGVVPNDAPILEKPEYKIPMVSEEPRQPILPVVETPQTPQPQAPQPKAQEQFVAKELPNTGLEDSSGLAALGLVGLLSSLGLTTKLRKKD